MLAIRIILLTQTVMLEISLIFNTCSTSANRMLYLFFSSVLCVSILQAWHILRYKMCISPQYSTKSNLIQCQWWTAHISSKANKQARKQEKKARTRMSTARISHHIRIPYQFVYFTYFRFVAKIAFFVVSFLRFFQLWSM